MKLAIIDIGSNTIRLCIYTQDADGQLITLFSKKEMAGLANYVRDGALSSDGIDRCCAALEHFKFLLTHIEVDQLNVFATASLRNISNTDEVLAEIEQREDIAIDLISGEDESVLGYRGVKLEHPIVDGFVFDIGGGSTEVSLIKDGKLARGKSFPTGSLKLYRGNVKNIWPTKQELRAMHRQTLETIEFGAYKKKLAKGMPMVGVGGSARAVLKCANIHFKRPRSSKTLSVDEFHVIRDLLIKRDDMAKDIVIKACPDRMHTLLPGLCIIDTVVQALKPGEIYIACNGVREGYASRVLGAGA